MTDPLTLCALIAIKASLILGILALLPRAVGRCWPSGCTVWQRLGIVTLLILPAAVSFFPSIAVPVLPPPKASTVATTPIVVTPLSHKIPGKSLPVIVENMSSTTGSRNDFQFFNAAANVPPDLIAETKAVDRNLVSGAAELKPLVVTATQRSTQFNSGQSGLAGIVVCYILVSSLLLKTMETEFLNTLWTRYLSCSIVAM